MGEFSGVGLFFVIALVFPLLALIPAWKLQPRQPTEEKQKPYECGVDTIGKNNIQYHIGYFMYALVFLLFLVKAVSKKLLFLTSTKKNKLCSTQVLAPHVKQMLN